MTINNRGLNIVLGLGLMVPLACKKSGEVSSEKKDPKNLQAAGTNPEDEKIDIPSNITGSYLACALRKEPTADQLEAEYGCRLSDPQTQNKLDLKDKLSQLTWSSNLSEGVTVVLTDSASPYHAFYRVKGPSFEAVQDKMRELEVIASWRLVSGTEVPVKREKIAQVLRPDVELETFQVPIDRDRTITPN